MKEAGFTMIYVVKLYYVSESTEGFAKIQTAGLTLEFLIQCVWGKT